VGEGVGLIALSALNDLSSALLGGSLYRLLLIPLGFVVGCYGTLVGAGGGFVLVPVLLLLYPRESPKSITSISLAVVFFNALSGSAAYARMKRIDYRTGLIFAAATAPGAVAGALTTGFFSRGVFNIVFGCVLIVASALVFLRPGPVVSQAIDAKKNSYNARTIVDADGVSYSYSFNLYLGVLISFGVGFASSLLGIGGGIIHVPALVQVLNFPAHIATATSHFILAIMALAGTITHIITGEYSTGLRRTILLAIGVLAGAQVGAPLSRRLKGKGLLRLLALALALVGARLIYASF
jgi:uncharacterized membrane protein YfcA